MQVAKGKPLTSKNIKYVQLVKGLQFSSLALRRLGGSPVRVPAF